MSLMVCGFKLDLIGFYSISCCKMSFPAWAGSVLKVDEASDKLSIP